MLDKLKDLDLRYEDLESQLGDPRVYGDAEKLRQVNRELKELLPVVETYRAYQAADSRRREAEELLHDPEMKEMAQDELAEAKEELEQLKEKLQEEGLFEPLPELIYPDQVSEFDQRSAFGAQNDLLSGRDIPLTPEVPEQPEPGDKPAGQNRRRRRGRGRGKGAEGAPEARAQGEKPSEKPAQKPDRQPGEPKREKRPNDQKPRPPRQNQERKPQGEKQPTDKPQDEKPEGAVNPDAPKRPRRRRYRGNKPAGGAPQAPKQGE